MCMITLYRGSISEGTKLLDNISRYTLDLVGKKLVVYPLLKEPQEFEIRNTINWDESNDSMIID